MDAITPRKRRSRYGRDPILNDEGKPHVIKHPTKNDEAIFRLLVSGSHLRRPWGYRLLRTSHIVALTGRNYWTVIDRLDRLEATPNHFLDKPQQPPLPTRPLIYELGDKGVKHLTSAGESVPKHRPVRNFRHELMECDIGASIELGAKETGTAIVPWPAIVASDGFPSRHLANPLYIPVGDEVLRPDWEPFVIHRPNHSHRFTFFPGFEADTGTEPLDASNPERSSIRKKFELYLQILERRIYNTHFGANTFMALFVTMDPVRMRSMVSLLEVIIKEKGYPASHAHHFAFKHIPGFWERPAPATGHMVTEPWSMAFGMPDYRMADPQ